MYEVQCHILCLYPLDNGQIKGVFFGFSTTFDIDLEN